MTGISAGIGLETARALVTHGAHVIGSMRDRVKAERATADFAALSGSGSLALVDVDLADLANVRACSDRLMTAALPLDGVIANAAIMAPPFARTVDGFEVQFGTNHMAHFVLVNRLTPCCGQKAAPSSWHQPGIASPIST